MIILLILLILFQINSKKYAENSYVIESANVFYQKYENKIQIAFGSCINFNRKNDSQIIRQISQKYKPDLMIFLGDIAYVSKRFKNKEFNQSEVEYQMNITKYHEDFMSLRENNIKVVGVWDDHDYGRNDGDITFKNKDQMQINLLKFYDISEESYLYKQKGIYRSTMLIVLLDTRYHKNPIEQDMLGQQQWEWLELQLKYYRNKLVIIATGTQFIADDRIFTESWFQTSKDRLKTLINKYNKYILLISGDIHHGEILKDPLSCHQLGFPLFELTSSGLTHLIFPSFYSIISSQFITKTLVNLFFPHTYNNQSQKLFDYNFATIEIHFNNHNLDHFYILLQIRDQHNQIQLQSNISSEFLLNSCSQTYQQTSQLNKYVRFILHLLKSFKYIIISVGIMLIYYLINRKQNDKRKKE